MRRGDLSPQRRARDRDRLRQEVLEGLGWTIVRVWSTDWVRNPGRQIDRIVAVYREKVGPFEENVRV